MILSVEGDASRAPTRVRSVEFDPKHLKLVIRVEELPARQRSSVYVLYWRFTGTKVQILVLGGVAP